MDWIMKALAIAGHFGFDDGNDFRTGLGNEGNFNKMSNPNYREGYVGVVLAASLYFGATELNAIFTNFNYTTYTNQFAAFGFSNVLAQWGSYNWKPILENGGSDAYGGHGAGVRNEFTYRGIGLTNRFGIFKKLADIMYGVDDSGVDTNKAPWVATSTVIDGLTNSGIGYSWTLNNGHSPYLGQRGQCYEFHATQGHGSNPTPRSDINYVCEGWNNSVATRASLQALGYWTGPVADVNDVESRMQVGSDDLISKAQNGFAGYSASTYQPVRYEADLQNRGYYYTKDLWLKALRSAPLPCNSAAGGGGWINTSIAAQTTTCVVEFDATPSLSPINSVIGLSRGVAQSYANLAAIVRFNPDGSIDARNGGGYAASSAIAYSAHQKCHFRLVINLSNHTYSAYMARAGDAEVAIGLDYAFRTEQMGVSRLDNVAWYVGSTNGANTVCNIATLPLRTVQGWMLGGYFVVWSPTAQGEVCLLETSSNLITWTAVSTNIAPSDTGVTFTNTSPGQPCFYRVRYRQ